MTAQKRTFNKQQNQPKALLDSFSILFYIGKFLGISSQDWREFKKYKQLKRSPGGDSVVVIIVVIVTINFNLMIAVFESSAYIEGKNTLSIVIGFVLTYFSLVAYLTDRITALLKQQCFADIFHDLEELDEDLMDFNIEPNNNRIKYRVFGLILLAALMETIIFAFTFALLVERNNWTAWLWMWTAIPTFLNSLDKVWYIGILVAIKIRFEALNKEFDAIATKLDIQQAVEENLKNSLSKGKTQLKKNNFKNKIKPAISNCNNIFGDIVSNPQLVSTSFNSTAAFSDQSSYSQLEKRLVKLCQLHDGLCNVGKQLNDVWAIPNLILMGYCFFIITAQLYFLYCSQAQQEIPSLFRPAQNLAITTIYLLYISFKCVGILMLNWLTNLESKKSGICIHRCALAADKDDVYEMINHLSLKLFNHLLDFNACGYFPLNMTTLFSFCGGITTYLIILIQFNIEEQQVKINSENKPMALKVAGNYSYMENMINGTIYENSTSLMGIFY